MPAFMVRCRAILFDLDGVLVDSRRCVEYVWRSWAAIHGRDPSPFIAVAHGRRTSETMREVAPELDVAAEVAVLDRMEETETRGVLPVPGARSLVGSVPDGRWAIVTSGSPAVARLRLSVAGISLPRVMVTGTDVRKGKPSPEGYLLAAGRLGVAPADCLVIEDAPAGIAAGRAAGMRVIAVAGTAPAAVLEAADHRVDALGELGMEAGEELTVWRR